MIEFLIFKIMIMETKQFEEIIEEHLKKFEYKSKELREKVLSQASRH